MSKTKIVVLHLKEIIYTAIFVGLGILLILLLVIMFLNKKDDSAATMTGPTYTPGVYTSTITLNDNALNLEVVLDEDHINSVRLVNIDEATTTMFPLVAPALEDIAEQLYDGVELDSITLSDDSRFTQTVIIDAIEAALDKAVVTATDE
ncbi:MAG: hypothetical protein K0S18_1059 [Anaerocolumna sp.]|jgi:uncharacterized protein with FMN-binding domain|nr:hypothetical protein [Anaerocolumna sp.]